MNKIIAFSALLAASTPTLAVGGLPTAIPEPSMLPLLGLGLIAIAFVNRLKNK